MNYDPTLTANGQFAEQDIKLKFQLWEYSKEITQTVTTNMTGNNAINCAIEDVFESLDRINDVPVIVLEHEHNGKTLEVIDEENGWVFWLKEMLVLAEIVAIRPAED